MKLGFIICVATTFFIMNTYNDGKYIELIKVEEILYNGGILIYGTISSLLHKKES